MRSSLFRFVLFLTLPLILSGCWSNDIAPATPAPANPLVTYQNCPVANPVVYNCSYPPTPAVKSSVPPQKKVSYAKKTKKYYNQKKIYKADAPSYEEFYGYNSGYKNYYSTYYPVYYPSSYTSYTSYVPAPVSKTYYVPVYQPQPQYYYQPSPPPQPPVYYQPQPEFQNIASVNTGVQISEWNNSGFIHNDISNNTANNFVY